MTTTEILIAAKALLTPEKWAQNPMTTQGQTCAMLALWASGGAFRERQVFYKANDISDRSNGAHWNDTHTYQEVLEGFDRAIRLAQQEEAPV